MQYEKTVFHTTAPQKALPCSSVISTEALSVMARCLAVSQYIPLERRKIPQVRLAKQVTIKSAEGI